MNTEVVFIIIVVFLVADFIVERILEWVNMRGYGACITWKS